MTGHAGRARQVVVTVDVAIDALTRWHGVHTGERETGTGEVEGGGYA